MDSSRFAVSKPLPFCVPSGATENNLGKPLTRGLAPRGAGSLSASLELFLQSRQRCPQKGSNKSGLNKGDPPPAPCPPPCPGALVRPEAARSHMPCPGGSSQQKKPPPRRTPHPGAHTGPAPPRCSAPPGPGAAPGGPPPAPAPAGSPDWLLGPFCCRFWDGVTFHSMAQRPSRSAEGPRPAACSLAPCCVWLCFSSHCRPRGTESSEPRPGHRNHRNRAGALLSLARSLWRPSETRAYLPLRSCQRALREARVQHTDNSCEAGVSPI